MTSPDTGAIFEETTNKMDMQEGGPSLRETTEGEWHVTDNHQQNLSFSDVRPANITVRNIGVEVDAVTPFMDTFKAKFVRPKVDAGGGVISGARRKKILKNLSMDFPEGTLTAIIGGSGSGKVRFRFHLYNRLET